MYMSNVYEEKVLNACRGTTATAPSIMYASLLRVLPTKDTSGEEVNYPDYHRVSMQFSEPAEEPSTFGVGKVGIKNVGDIAWATISGGAQGTAVGVGFYDDVSGGNLWAYVEIPEGLVLGDREKPTIYDGECHLVFEGKFTKYFSKKVLNLLRGITLEGFTPYIGLTNGNVESGGIELSGSNYSRQPVRFGAPIQQLNNQAICTNTEKITFNTPTTNWGLWTHNAYYESAISSQAIFISQLQNDDGSFASKPLKIGYTPEAEIGDIELGVN